VQVIFLETNLQVNKFSDGFSSFLAYESMIAVALIGTQEVNGCVYIVMASFTLG